MESRDLYSQVVADRIRLVLTDNKVSVNKLAEKLGMNQSTLNKQIKGDTPIPMETLGSIVQMFPSVSAEWLLRGEGDMKKGSSIKQEVKKMFCPGDDTIFQQVNSGANDSDLRKEIKELKAEKERLLGIIEKLTGSKG